MDALVNDYKPAQTRDAFTVLELLVSFTIIGMLISLLLPALMCAREATRRTCCLSHLRELGIAMHHYHDSTRRLPLAWTSAEQDPGFAYGWMTQLLPTIEELPRQRAIDFKKRPSTVALSDDGIKKPIAILLCPSDISEPTFALSSESGVESDSSSFGLITLPTANYVGVFGTSEADEFAEFPDRADKLIADGSVIHNRSVSFADLCRGLSNTFLVGERMMATVPSTWLGVDMRGEDAPCRLVGSAMTRPNCSECDECEFSSRHPEGTNFLWADGHVTFIDNSVETATYREFAQRVTN